jgi:hypothetical protein
VTLSEIYQSREKKFEEQSLTYQKQFDQLSWLRVGLFVGGGLLAYVIYNERGVLTAVIATLFFTAGFILSLKKHNRVEYQRNHYRFLKTVNQDEALRLQNQFSREETGDRYEESAHAYTSDLDIFGKHSIFRLLNRTHTQAGGQKLADWLKRPSASEEIMRRQKAITELKPLLDWRQNLEAKAIHYQEVGQKPSDLLHWMEEPALVHQSFWMRLFRFLPLISIPVTFAWVFDLVSIQIFALFILGHLLILRQIFKAVKATCDKTHTISKTLLAYADIIREIEKETFSTHHLRTLQESFNDQNQKASQAIGRLAIILQNLNYRNNPYFYGLVGIISLWDLKYFIQLEDWKESHRTVLPQWLETLAEWEALNSLAGFAFSNPDYCQPVISEQPFELEASALGHVLISKEKRVVNDIAFSGLGKTLVITGSNMSGKSTFLRTVGVNVVLALAGAPVCAQAFTVSVIQVFTGMRTQDSLEESVSSFYAELKRLRQLIQGVESAVPTLYFLDEILKGTNSRDRHEGAKALIRQLHRYPASGFISTHDLELGKMAEEHSEYVQNYSFNSEIVEGKLYFDYKLRKGICHSFNASELMKQIGIEM